MIDLVVAEPAVFSSNMATLILQFLETYNSLSPSLALTPHCGSIISSALSALFPGLTFISAWQSSSSSLEEAYCRIICKSLHDTSLQLDVLKSRIVMSCGEREIKESENTRNLRNAILKEEEEEENNNNKRFSSIFWIKFSMQSNLQAETKSLQKMPNATTGCSKPTSCCCCFCSFFWLSGTQSRDGKKREAISSFPSCSR